MDQTDKPKPPMSALQLLAIGAALGVGLPPVPSRDVGTAGQCACGRRISENKRLCKACHDSQKGD